MLLSIPCHPAVRLEASVEPDTAAVGDRLQFKVIAAAETGDRLDPFAPGETLGPFEVADFRAAPPQTLDGAVRQEFLWTLVSFEVGTSTIPAVTFQYRAADGKERRIQTPEIPVRIKSVLPPDAKDIRDIKGTFVPPRRWTPLWALLAAAAALTGGAWLWRRRKRRGGPAAPAAPPRPPEETALEALGRLEGEMSAPSKAFYTRLSDVLRAYLEGRFGLSALDRTTAELSHALKDLPVDRELRMGLREALETADLAKFARLESPSEERLANLARVRDFVLAARPRPAPAETAAP